MSETVKKTISIVVPCYNEQESIALFDAQLAKVIDQMSQFVCFELIFVDDGSTDNTLNMIKKLADTDKKVKYISFSRNFGKEAAMYAGLKKAAGDFVAIMDVDLQDPPHLLLCMYQGIVDEGYDCVGTRRVTRKGEPAIRSFFARCFYRIINKISSTHIVEGTRDYRLMSRQMVDAVLSLAEKNRFSKGIFSWVGFKTKWLEYENVARAAGETKWSFWRLLVYSMEGIVAFSTVPLALATVLGTLLCLVAFGLLCAAAVKSLLLGQTVSLLLWGSIGVCFVSGIQLFCTGILGQYLSTVYLESKNRPIYITKEEN